MSAETWTNEKCEDRPDSTFFLENEVYRNHVNDVRTIRANRGESLHFEMCREVGRERVRRARPL